MDRAFATMGPDEKLSFEQFSHWLGDTPLITTYLDSILPYFDDEEDLVDENLPTPPVDTGSFIRSRTPSDIPPVLQLETKGEEATMKVELLYACYPPPYLTHVTEKQIKHT